MLMQMLFPLQAAGSFKKKMLIIGANLGTTVTIIIGSLGQKVSVAKKRVAFAHFVLQIHTGCGMPFQF